MTDRAPLDELQQRIVASVDRSAETLVAVAHDMHARPELAFEERFAHTRLCDELEAAGLRVERRLGDLETAFRASAGLDGPRVAILCEYDALPEIGHACGHNVIAAAGLGAGLALAELAGAVPGRVDVVGTPAEEAGGGKLRLIEADAFAEVDAAMMVHPADADTPRVTGIAFRRIEVELRGRAAHAAASPELGRNALDAAVLGYTAVAALRQHIAVDERVHGIITHGGDKANVVPDRTAMEWFVRAPTLDALGPLCERVLACLRGGADAAGCTMSQRADPPYADVRHNEPLLERYAAIAELLGRPLDTARPPLVVSTDLGNLSQVVPTIQPNIAIAPAGVSLHSREFAACARDERADRAVVDGAKALALTALEVWRDPALLPAIRKAFGRRGNGPVEGIAM